MSRRDTWPWWPSFVGMYARARCNRSIHRLTASPAPTAPAGLGTGLGHVGCRRDARRRPGDDASSHRRRGCSDGARRGRRARGGQKRACRGDRWADQRARRGARGRAADDRGRGRAAGRRRAPGHLHRGGGGARGRHRGRPRRVGHRDAESARDLLEPTRQAGHRSIERGVVCVLGRSGREKNKRGAHGGLRLMGVRRRTTSTLGGG